MLSNKKGTALALIALLALASTVPLASASNVTTTVYPSSDSANVTAYVNTTVNLKTNNTAFQGLISLLGNLTGHTSVSVSDKSQAFVAVQNAIRNNTSSAKLTYLSLSLNAYSKKVSSIEWYLNYSLKVVMNITNIYHNGTFDLGWRGFYDNSSVTVNHVSYNKINAGNGTVKEYSALNFTAFSKPLTQWQRNYDTAKNVTSFTTNAGYTFNYDKNTTFLDQTYVNTSIKSDPSYTIIAPGYATAGSNSITIAPAPNGGFPIIAAVAVVAILGAGFAVTVALRRKR